MILADTLVNPLSLGFPVLPLNTALWRSSMRETFENQPSALGVIVDFSILHGPDFKVVNASCGA